MEQKFLIGSEAKLISASILDPRAFDALVSLPTNLFCEAHRPIVEAFKAMQARGDARDHFGDFEAVILNRCPDSYDLLHKLADNGGFADWESKHYPQLQRLKIANKMLSSVHEIAKNPADEIDPVSIAQSVVNSLAEGSQGQLVGCSKAFDGDNIFEPIPTGMTLLDNALDGGVGRGKVLVVGARPRVGKTAFATSIAAVAWLRHSVRTLFISAEMTPADLQARVLSACTGEPAKHFLRKEVRSPKTQEICDKFSSDPIQYFFKRGMTVEEACGVIHMYSKQHEGQRFLVVLDYLQRLNVDDHNLDDVRKIQKVALMLSDECNRSKAPLIVLAQLGRQSESDDPKKEDKLSDLKGSGAIEEMADGIAFIKRDWNFEPSFFGEDQECEIKIMKNRGGGYPRIPLRYTPNLTRFSAR